MRKARVGILLSIIFLFGLIEIFSCSDDNDVTPSETVTPEVYTPTPTYTPKEITPTVTPTPAPTFMTGKSLITFSKMYGDDGHDFGSAVQQTDDGKYVITGTTSVSGIGYGVYLIKIDRFGQKLWSRSFAQHSYSNQGYSVQQTNDGGYIIVGGSSRQYYPGEVVFWVYLIKTDDKGNEIWSKKFGASSNNGASIERENELGSTANKRLSIVYTGYSVQQTYDGGYVIAGIADGTMNDRLYLLKTDSEGNFVWSKKFKGNNRAWGNCVRQTYDGGYVVVGGTFTYYSDNGNSEDIYFLKTDSDGNILWSRTFGGLGSDIGNSVQLTDDGGYIIAGFTNSYNETSYRIYLIKTNGYGDEVWSSTFGGSGNYYGKSVDTTDDGGYIITGSMNSHQNVNDTDVYLVKTDDTGIMLWSRRFGGGKEDAGGSIQQTCDGGYVITGYTYSAAAGSSSEVFLIKTDISGYVFK